MSIDDLAELMPNRLSMLARGVSQSTQFVPRVRPRGARKARGLRGDWPFGGPNEKRAAKARIHYIYGGEGVRLRRTPQYAVTYHFSTF